ncbi:MAG TPA: class I SAM-dependent methyltransferase [Solirubrobacteraceae bacterium]|nr:class I SAM-dependent methyltransferase [Solirubrobacteraceae bacterium]
MLATAAPATLLRRALIRFPRVRQALVAVVPRLRAKRYDLAHLAFIPEETAIGPLQRDEALVLHGIVRTIRPAVIVEFGFLMGDSALNFLQALPPDSRVHSFDISEEAAAIARGFPHPNFTFHRKSQDQITAADVEFAPIDLVFLDASHDLDINRATFDRVEALLADDAIVVVHDTGAWPAHLVAGMPPHARFAAQTPEGWVTADEFVHQPDERAFVNWLRDVHPEFAQIHLHSSRVIRHGLTVLQRSRRLATPTDSAPAASSAQR